MGFKTTWKIFYRTGQLGINCILHEFSWAKYTNSHRRGSTLGMCTHRFTSFQSKTNSANGEFWRLHSAEYSGVYMAYFINMVRPPFIISRKSCIKRQIPFSANNTSDRYRRSHTDYSQCGFSFDKRKNRRHNFQAKRNVANHGYELQRYEWKYTFWSYGSQIKCIERRYSGLWIIPLSDWKRTISWGEFRLHSYSSAGWFSDGICSITGFNWRQLWTFKDQTTGHRNGNTTIWCKRGRCNKNDSLFRCRRRDKLYFRWCWYSTLEKCTNQSSKKHRRQWGRCYKTNQPFIRSILGYLFCRTS